MNPPDVPAILDQIGDRLDEVLQSTTEPASRTTRLTELLRRLCPHASLHACLLMDSGQPSLAVLDESGNSSPAWLERLHPHARTREELASLWPSLLNGAGQTALVHSLSRAGAWHGLAALRLPQSSGDSDRRLATTVLGTFAQMLAMLLTLETCRQDLQEQERLANAGELAGVVSHEFTNFLNVLLLQVSLLECQLPDSHRADLVEIRRQGNVAAELVRQFQDYRHGLAPPAQQVDLHQALVETAEELENETTSSQSLHLALDAGRLWVEGSRPAIQRLLRFLVSNAARAAAQTGGQVHVRTERTAESVVLCVEDSGPSVAAEELPYLFDPLHSAREGVDVLELAACKALVRRMGGSVRAEGRSGGGVSVIVEWPCLP